MAHSVEGNADRTDDAEVARLMNELVSEIGASEIPPEIRGLAFKLQELLDERAEKRVSPVGSLA